MPLNIFTCLASIQSARSPLLRGSFFGSLRERTVAVTVRDRMRICCHIGGCSSERLEEIKRVKVEVMIIAAV